MTLEIHAFVQDADDQDTASLLMSYFSMSACLHLPQEILRIEILYNPTANTLFDGRAERSYLLLIILK